MKTTDNNERRLLVATTTMFVIAAGVFGGFFYLNNRARAQNVNLDEVYIVKPDGNLQRPKVDRDMERAIHQVAIERVMVLRDKFRPWALQNKDILQKMLSARPTDEAALQTVFEAVPLHPKQAGFAAADFSAKLKPAFTWVSIEKMAARTTNVKNPQLLKQHVEYARKGRLLNFRDYRDMVVSSSVNTGPTGVVLWVSGRVTQYKLTGGRDRRPGYEGFATTETEIAPPYDFLKSTIQVNTSPAHVKEKGQ